MSDNNGGGNRSGGIGIGAVIAILPSWTTNHSVGYCILHGICSWFYIIYWLCYHS